MIDHVSDFLEAVTEKSLERINWLKFHGKIVETCGRKLCTDCPIERWENRALSTSLMR